jgi:hypothetical protein
MRSLWPTDCPVTDRPPTDLFDIGDIPGNFHRILKDVADLEIMVEPSTHSPGWAFHGWTSGSIILVEGVERKNYHDISVSIYSLRVRK